MPRLKKVSETNSVTEIAVLSNFGLTPFFAATPQTGEREVQFANNNIWRQGVDNPFRVPPVEQRFRHGLDVTHAHLFFSLLAYYRTYNLNYYVPVRMSYNSMLRLAHWKKSDHSFRLLKATLADLGGVWTKFTSPENPVPVYFKLLGDPKVNEEEDLDGTLVKTITFDPSFRQFAELWERKLLIQLDAWNGMSSKIARSLYLYLPSRAFHHTAADPFRISLPLILVEVGVSVPPRQAKKIMTQNTNSILKQLDGSPLQYSRTLRVKIQDNMLQVWAEVQSIQTPPYPPRKLNKSALLAWYIAGGGTEEEYREKTTNAQQLDQYERKALEEAGIKMQDHIAFLQLAKALLEPGKFSELAGEMRVLSYSQTVSVFYLIGIIRRQLTGDFFVLENEELKG